MPLSEKELQLIPQFEKLSVDLERTGLQSWKTRLSQAEKRKIFQVATLINKQQSSVTPKAKFRRNLEKSIENHMKRMANCTGKNIRIIRPPPEGLKVLKNGEWIIPKRQSDFKNNEERTKQLLSHVPMTIPEIETKNYKKLQNSSKPSLNKKTRISLVTRQLPRQSDSDQIKRFKRIFKKFLKKRTEFMRSVNHLRNELEDIRFEYSATQVISRSISQMNELAEWGGSESERPVQQRGGIVSGIRSEIGNGKRRGIGDEPTRRRRRRLRRRDSTVQLRSTSRALRGIGSCPEFPGKRKT
uniref:Exocyst complex component 1 n=1 Tax=Lygus hesperus TaxID=30085 RepID=A0A0A9YFM6_LYGHE